jgi:hypothetical protein
MIDFSKTATNQFGVAKGVDVSDIHVDRPLSNFTIAYVQSQDEFIGGDWFKVLPVDQISGKFYKYDKNSFFQMMAKPWVPGSNMAQATWDMSTPGTFSCNFKACEMAIPAHLSMAADQAINIDRSVTDIVTRKILLDREYTIASNFFVGTAWLAANRYTTNDFSTWDQYDISSPLEDFKTMKSQVYTQGGIEPNTAVMSYAVYETLRLHPEIKNIYKYTSPANLTTQQIAQALGLKNILVGKAKYMSSAEGVTEVMADMWGKHCWVGYVPPSMGPMTPAPGAIFSWTGMTAGFETAIERVPDRRTHADYVQAFNCVDTQVTASDLGAFFTGAVS